MSNTPEPERTDVLVAPDKVIVPEVIVASVKSAVVTRKDDVDPAAIVAAPLAFMSTVGEVRSISLAAEMFTSAAEVADVAVIFRATVPVPVTVISEVVTPSTWKAAPAFISILSEVRSISESATINTRASPALVVDSMVKSTAAVPVTVMLEVVAPSIEKAPVAFISIETEVRSTSLSAEMFTSAAEVADVAAILRATVPVPATETLESVTPSIEKAAPAFMSTLLVVRSISESAAISTRASPALVVDSIVKSTAPAPVTVILEVVTPSIEKAAPASIVIFVPAVIPTAPVVPVTVTSWVDKTAIVEPAAEA